jgi:hypothetical protein
VRSGIDRSCTILSRSNRAHAVSQRDDVHDSFREQGLSDPFECAAVFTLTLLLSYAGEPAVEAGS